MPLNFYATWDVIAAEHIVCRLCDVHGRYADQMVKVVGPLDRCGACDYMSSWYDFLIPAVLEMSAAQARPGQVWERVLLDAKRAPTRGPADPLAY